MSRSHVLAVAFIAVLQLASNGVGFAQTTPPANGTATPAPLEKPQRTTASFDDWVLQCEKRMGPPPEKTCDIAQVAQAQVQGKNVPFSLIAIPRPVSGKPTRVLIQLPVNASFKGNVIIQTDKADPGIAAPFARCVTTGCVAEFELKDDAVKKLRAASGTGSITFKDAAEKDIAVPLSFKGLGPALDALAKE